MTAGDIEEARMIAGNIEEVEGERGSTNTKSTKKKTPKPELSMLFSIGNDYSEMKRGWGFMSRFRLYNESLTDSEIADITTHDDVSLSSLAVAVTVPSVFLPLLPARSGCTCHFADFRLHGVLDNGQTLQIILFGLYFLTAEHLNRTADKA